MDIPTKEKSMAGQLRRVGFQKLVFFYVTLIMVVASDPHAKEVPVSLLLYVQDQYSAFKMTSPVTAVSI